MATSRSAGPSGSTSTITVGEHTTEHFTDFQDGNITLDVAAASSAHVTYIEDAGDIRMVVHPGMATKRSASISTGVTSSDDLVLGDDGHGHLQVTWGGASEAPAHTAHDIDVANQAAAASFVHTTPDVI